MNREPQKPERGQQAEQAHLSRKDQAGRRFQILKLEERIAPFHRVCFTPGPGGQKQHGIFEC